MKMTLNEEIEYLQSGNWYDKVQAILPTDEYLKLGWAIGDILETLELFRSLAPEPQTNGDRIRAMSDKELAVFLDGFTCNCIDCRDNDGKNESCPIYNRQRCRYCEPKDIMDWLQSPTKEDT